MAAPALDGVVRQLDFERPDAEQRAPGDLDIAGPHLPFDDLEAFAAAHDARFDGERLAQERAHEVCAEAHGDDIVAPRPLERVRAERGERAAVHEVGSPRSRRGVGRDEAIAVDVEECLRAQ